MQGPTIDWKKVMKGMWINVGGFIAGTNSSKKLRRSGVGRFRHPLLTAGVPHDEGPSDDWFEREWQRLHIKMGIPMPHAASLPITNS